jgi:Type IV secretion-system coupling protein DNA-binding domain
MRYTKDRCLACGCPTRQADSISIDDYWFCSQKCHDRTAKTFMEDPQYQREPTASDENYFWLKKDDPFWRETDLYAGDFNSYWDQMEKHEVGTGAEAMVERIKAEARMQRAKEAEEEERERQKQEVKEQYEREREDQLEEAAMAREETLKAKPIPERIRLEHTMILGPSGSGKTTLLQNNILMDFWKPPNEDEKPLPAYIILDPKGLMVERLSKLIKFQQWKDHVIYIDPYDEPALNLFETHGRDPSQLISDFSYIFSTTRQKLTGKQLPCFSFCARLLFTLPHANLFTLLDLLDDRTNKKPPNPLFQGAIAKLPETARRFFENDFYSSTYASTREEIKSRIWGVLENDHLSKMFNANTRKLNLAKCISHRKIVLINTRMTQMREAHQTLGRYMIALAQDAIQSRREKHPVYLVIDEFQEFADPTKTPQLLRLMREYGGGAVIAFQNMYCDELDDATRNAISTNTSIKYASSPEGQDLNYMARDMRCTPEFLKDMQCGDTHAQFACYVRGLVQHPFISYSQLGWVDRWPKMSDEQYRAERARNKAALQDTPITHEAPKNETSRTESKENKTKPPAPWGPRPGDDDDDPTKPAKKWGKD